MFVHRALKPLAGLLLSGALALAGAASAQAPSADAGAVATQPGSWQSHKQNFWFMGFTATYSCDGLSDQLTLLLKQMGAREDMKIAPLCTRDFGRPDKMAQANLTFSSLQPDGGSTPTNAPATDQSVAGTWRHIEWAPHRPYQLGGGDCELIEQVRDKILPLFTVRNVDNKVSCVPHQDSGNQFFLSFDVFAPVSAPKKS